MKHRPNALRLHRWQLAMFLRLLQVPSSESVAYLPSSHVDHYIFIRTYVRRAMYRPPIERVLIRVIMLASRQALGVSL